MDGPRELNGREGAFARSFLSRTLTRQSTRASTSDDPAASSVSRGPLGLNTVYDPQVEHAVADLVFVHGLNGGSQSTWSKGNNPATFWPQEWLPKDEAFRDVRIHSFGYPSGIGRDSIMGLRDFAKLLLGSIKDSPAMDRGEKVGNPQSASFTSPVTSFCSCPYRVAFAAYSRPCRSPV